MIRYCLVVLMTVVAVFPLFAQPDLPPPGPGTPVPISGMERLAVAGAMLGCARLLKKKFTKPD